MLRQLGCKVCALSPGTTSDALYFLKINNYDPPEQGELEIGQITSLPISNSPHLEHSAFPLR
jgi:hypothetical protein